jgi:hypothetical protein
MPNCALTSVATRESTHDRIPARTRPDRTFIVALGVTDDTHLFNDNQQVSAIGTILSPSTHSFHLAKLGFCRQLRRAWPPIWVHAPSGDRHEPRRIAASLRTRGDVGVLRNTDRDLRKRTTPSHRRTEHKPFAVFPVETVTADAVTTGTGLEPARFSRSDMKGT